MIDICPATAGLPTRVLRRSWEKICKSYQDKARGYGRSIVDMYGYGYCLECKGGAGAERG